MTTQPAIELERYYFDPAASTFVVRAFAEGLFAAFGHDPVVHIKEFSGEAEYVPGTFGQASLKLLVNANSLVVVNNIKAQDRRDIEKTMRNEVLETSRYPEIVFKSNNISLTRVAEGRYRARVIGELTLHGVTQHDLSVNGEVTRVAEGLRLKGEFSI